VFKKKKIENSSTWQFLFKLTDRSEIGFIKDSVRLKWRPGQLARLGYLRVSTNERGMVKDDTEEGGPLGGRRRGREAGYLKL
jgi:hypothetical protein